MGEAVLAMILLSVFFTTRRIWPLETRRSFVFSGLRLVAMTLVALTLLDRV